ncbi:MAG: hypothetical protein RR232_06115 [Clostridia bacterium]
MGKNDGIVSGCREAVRALREICADPEAKQTDRIAAARLLMEYGMKEEADQNVLRVVMDVPKEMCT